MNNILVSICCITYNHEKYIRDAIEGFLMQQTSFNYEVIIADDCSTDNTDVIIKEYIQKHPKGNIIKYFRHEKNIGMMPNFVFALRQCTGKYIALCDGDDYWTDPLKLQKQVDFLEKNEDYVLVAHNIDIKNGDTVEHFEKTQVEYFLSDFYESSCLSTASVVFKNIGSIDLKKICGALVGDWPLFIMLAENGRIGFMKEYMAVYRVHANGVWSGDTNKEKYTIEILKSLIEVFPQYKTQIKDAILNKMLYWNLYDFSIIAILEGRTPLKALFKFIKHKVKICFFSLIKSN